MPTFGSLFAGVGGFDLGFESAGWECKFQVEWDKHCQTVLDRHWPDNHTAEQADTQRYKQCGNGVAAPVAEWVATHLKPLLEEN